MKNMPCFVVCAALAGSLLAANPPAQQTRSAEALLGAALHQEEVEGNLEAAIETYKKILADYPVIRPVAARALLQMGKCYEKLGRDEARKAYERLVREYADQSEQAKVAQSRLAAMDRPAVRQSGTATRRVWTGPKTDFFGAVSPDGKSISFVDWETGDLAVRDLEKGTDRRITNKGSWESNPNEEAELSIWSPDSKQIAYQWSASGGYELRVIGLDNPTPRMLHRCKSVQEYMEPFDWSPDGKYILGVINKEDANQQMVLLSVADGTVRTLKELPQGTGLARAAISPDGHYILYDYPQSGSSLAHDIFLLPVAGGRETPLVEYPADDLVLGWAPDGKWVLFASDRRGSVDVWAVRLEEGKPQGAPVMVKPAVGRIVPLGLTRNGSFYYGVGGARNDVYVVKMDPATGGVLAPPTKLVKHFEGYNGGPQYSPDGKSLAYLSRRENRPLGGTGWGDTLCVRSQETGEEREYQRGMTRLGVRGFGYPRWSPDGRSILLYGRDSRDRYGIYHINLETGNAVNIVRSGEDLFVGPADGWRDGRSFFYGRVDKKNDRAEICVRDLDSGDEKVLYGVSPAVNGALALSPDRRWVSTLDSSRSKDGKVLSVISTDSGEVKRLFKFSQKDNPGFIRHAWSADSKSVFYTRRVATQGSYKFEVWRLPVDGGQPQRTGLEMPGAIDHMSAHPDGEHVAFENMAPMSVNPAEIWVMENFLPPAGKSK
jgi:Tol biopolymer transport system component